MTEKRKHVAAVFDLQWPFRRHYGPFGGVQEYAREHGDWTFDISNFPEIEIGKGRHFDGIIGRITADCAATAKKAGIPLINTWMDSPVGGSIPEVYPDVYQAGRIACEHLFNRGFSKIVYFGSSKLAPVFQFNGIQEFATKNKIEAEYYGVSSQWDERSEDWERFEAAVLCALTATKETKIGVVCSTDALARAIATICLKEGILIPEDIGIVGTGNDELICTLVDPMLSSVAMGYVRSGYEAGRLLDRMMAGDSVEMGATLTPPRELILRRSSDVYSVDDPKVEMALRFMVQNLHKPQSVDDISRAVGVGRKTLERRFKSSIRRPVNSELTRMRISKMKRLLAETQLNIGELGEQCGFGNMVSLHKLFKRATGLTPGQYRERHGRKILD